MSMVYERAEAHGHTPQFTVTVVFVDAASLPRVGDLCWVDGKEYIVESVNVGKLRALCVPTRRMTVPVASVSLEWKA